jgi:ABC-type transport system involved in cytochrome c biogenesis permease component
MKFLPIVERELRIAARRSGTYWLRFFAALTAMVIALLIANSMSYWSASMVAKQVFGFLSGVLMAYCLFAGMFQTADCLSSEKREGTLGLLFLTDLHGYDVVLGKLAASSLHAVYGLVAVLPVLAIPLLAGGVTPGEYWRVVVVLLATIFFSLGVGMAVSAVGRESRQAFGFSAFLVIFTAGLLPALQQLLSMLFKINIGAPLQWPSAGYALRCAWDGRYHYRTGPQEFWGSISTIALLGFIGLALAAVVLPRVWQEKGEARDMRKGGSLWRRIRFGTIRRRQALKGLLTKNPFHWLAVRDRVSQVSFWIGAMVVAPFWLGFLHLMRGNSGSRTTQFVSIQILTFITFGVSFAFKCLVASEGTRRLNDDRKSGALELILVTPLSEIKIIAGQQRALRSLFLVPMALLECLFVILGITYFLEMAMMHDEGIFAVIILGNMVVLVADVLAMGWVGLWAGLSARNHQRAIMAVLLRILILPWVLYFVLGVMGFFHASTPVPLFVAWYSICIVNDVIWANIARKNLRSRFRQVASGDKGSRRLPPQEARLERVTA